MTCSSFVRWRLSASLALTTLALTALPGCSPAAGQPDPTLTAAPAAMPTDPPAEGSVSEISLPSGVLGHVLRYVVYLPAGYETSGLSYPVLYLLHGRGDNMASWARIKPDLDELIAAGRLPPLIAILPDAPASQRASYYVDSDYSGEGAPGEPVETAFLSELVPHVDAAYRTLADRAARAVGGYSMGGYGALRYGLAHPAVFSAALVFSPAVYVPLPPADSSTREFGAFGRGADLFVPEIYQAKNYPALLEAFAQQAHAVRIFIAVGDDEYRNPNPDEAVHDIDLESHVLFNRLVRQPNITAELRVLDGGHGWDVWTPAFREGAQWVFRFLRPPE